MMTESIPAGPDPAALEEIAHLTADVVVHRGRAEADPEVLERLVTLVDREGIDAVAEMWASSPANTLPGALWRMYLLREWVRTAPEVFALHYRLGSESAEVSHVVAGVSSPPNPQDVADLADRVLSGLFVGDLDVALERAAAFCRVVAVGATYDADSLDHAGSGPDGEAAGIVGNLADQPISRGAQAARRITAGASSLEGTARDLEEAATLWRRRRLD